LDAKRRPEKKITNGRNEIPKSSGFRLKIRDDDVRT
jgi:hypothetical protein